MRIAQVDAFVTDGPFTGNPAVVCLLDAPAGEAWMQAVATEMNVSETAFVEEPGSDGTRVLRWFTPTVEVELCGHATLATAHILWEQGREDPGRQISFSSRSGRLLASRHDDGSVELDFPASPPTEAWAPPDLVEALGVQPTHTATDGKDWLVELASEWEVRAVRPDLRRLATVPTRGTMITAPAEQGSGADIVTRYFAPAIGIDEEPVTGSSACCLGPWWSARLQRDDLVVRHASRRGGQLRLVVRGDRVSIAGRAVTVVRGELAV